MASVAAVDVSAEVVVVVAADSVVESASLPLFNEIVVKGFHVRTTWASLIKNQFLLNCLIISCVKSGVSVSVYRCDCWVSANPARNAVVACAK